MRIAVDRPLLAGSGKSVFLTGAIMDALSIDGAPLVNSGLVSFYTTGTTLIISTSLEQNQILTLDASRYNNNPAVQYRLPSDLKLEIGTSPSIYSESIGLPKERRYSIEVAGFESSIDPSMLRLYRMNRSYP